MRTEADADSRPVEGSIISKLQAAFSPTHLEVLNESASHNVPRGSETHFKVIVVSDGFAGVGPLDRHRLVNGALADELAGCVLLPRFATTPIVPASHPRASRSLAPCLAGVCTRYRSWRRLRRSGQRRATFRRRHHASVGAIGESGLYGLKVYYRSVPSRGVQSHNLYHRYLAWLGSHPLEMFINVNGSTGHGFYRVVYTQGVPRGGARGARPLHYPLPRARRGAASPRGRDTHVFTCRVVTSRARRATGARTRGEYFEGTRRPDSRVRRTDKQ